MALDFVEKQLNRLIEDSISTISTKEAYERVEAVLDFDDYLTTPPHPKNDTSTGNPAVDEYFSRLNWDDGWTPIDETAILRQYPEFLPTPQALECLTNRYTEIVEIGAGNGYWAYVLKNNGLKVLPIDRYPVDIEDAYDYTIDESGLYDGEVTRHSGTPPYSMYYPEDEYYSAVWCESLLGDHRAVTQFPETPILLCHPVVDEWVEELLDLMAEGQELIFVGEWYPGVDATPNFFYELTTEWTHIDSFPVYRWQSHHAGGHIFRK